MTQTTIEAPAAEQGEHPAEAVGDSMTVAVWTAISRATGVVRGVVIAAVLGATLFANTYQFTNSLPNLVFYGFLGGSMLSSLLIPALVRHVDTGDRAAAERVAGGFLGIVGVGTAVLFPLAVVAGPVALHFTAPEQTRSGMFLVLMLLPQIPLYGLVATAGAAMNAHGRFALAAAAPALENVGTVVVLALVAVLYQNPDHALLLLGLGTTGAVALHASAQWWGARRAGVRLRPRRGWRDPEVRRVLARSLPSLGQAALSALQLLVLLVFANRVAGGVVAFQLAMNFYFLPIALGATPVALSLAPRLARLHAAGRDAEFRDAFVRGLLFALFVAAPAAAGYLAIREPISRAIAYGGFGTDAGTALIAASVGALALGVLGETVFLVATYACYAREDTRTPMHAMIVQLVICVAGACTAPLVTGPAVLLVLGGSLTTGTLIGAAVLLRAVLRRLARGSEPVARPLLRTLLAAIVMAVPAWAVGGLIKQGVPSVLAAGLTGVVVYGAVQSWLGAPEIGWIMHNLRKRLPTAPVRKSGPLRKTGPVRKNGPLRTIRPVRTIVVNAGLLLAAVVLGAVTGYNPYIALALAAGVVICVGVYLRPQVAAYLLIFLTPLTAGIDRGTLIPVLRPNEAVAALVGVALAIRWLVRLRTGQVRLARLDAIDWTWIGMAVFSSFAPLLMMLVRRREIVGDDLQYSIVMWKFFAIYLIFRFSVSTKAQAVRVVVLSVASACVVSVVGILQSLGLFGVPALLGTLYAPFGAERVLSIGRGSSTLALAAAVADLATINVVLAIGLLLYTRLSRRWLVVALVICVFGTLGAGEFSTILGLLVALGALVIVTRQTRLVGWSIPLLLIGAVVMWPVLETRLLGFQSASGLPQSWVVRLRNLNTYFWPQLTADDNWILGVRPAARVATSHEEFGYVWIESGYTWLLWGGGIPLLGAYVVWVVVCLRRGIEAARRASGIVSVIGLTVASAVAADVFLMIFDPHLTYRGAADNLLALLAMLRTLGPARGDPAPATATARRRPEVEPAIPERVA